MSWNNRIMKYDTGEYGIHEVYYDDKGNVDGWTKNSKGLYGNSIDDLRKGYLIVEEAFSKPILDYATGKEI